MTVSIVPDVYNNLKLRVYRRTSASPELATFSLAQKDEARMLAIAPVIIPVTARKEFACPSKTRKALRYEIAAAAKL